MIVEIIEANEDSDTIAFKNKSEKVYKAFSHQDGFGFTVGEKVEVEFSSLDDDLKWDQIFQGNKEKKKALVAINNNWEYEAYGQIIKINPIIADFGDIELELGNWTHDEKVIGEYIYWKIERLDIDRVT